MPKSMNEWSDPKNVPQFKGKSSSEDYPKTARDFELSYAKTGKIPFTGMPQPNKTKSPYSELKSKSTVKKKAKTKILKKGWIEEV